MLSIVLGYDLQAEDLRVEAARHFIVRTSDSGVMDAQKHDDGSENVRLSIRNGLYWPSCLPCKPPRLGPAYRSRIERPDYDESGSYPRWRYTSSELRPSSATFVKQGLKSPDYAFLKGVKLIHSNT
jgi:hypothetical protein